MKNVSGRCRIPNCDRVQGLHTEGYCVSCYTRELQKSKVAQNDMMIQLLIKLNQNIENLAVKIENIETKQTVLIKDTTESKSIINQVQRDIEDMFIPSINTKSSVTNISSSSSSRQTTRDLNALANRLNKIENQ